MLSILQQIDPSITIEYLILGYAVMWAVAAIYVFYLYIQQRNLERDIAFLREILRQEMENK